MYNFLARKGEETTIAFVVAAKHSSFSAREYLALKKQALLCLYLSFHDSMNANFPYALILRLG